MSAGARKRGAASTHRARARRMNAVRSARVGSHLPRERRRRRGARIDAWRCERGHVSLHPAEACPRCEASLRAARVRAVGRLELVTTVRVTPDGSPRRLGLVRAAGARALCMVEGDVRGCGSDRVTLERRDGRLIARGRDRRGDDRTARGRADAAG